jgi:hypothetical protein
LTHRLPPEARTYIPLTPLDPDTFDPGGQGLWKAARVKGRDGVGLTSQLLPRGLGEREYTVDTRELWRRRRGKAGMRCMVIDQAVLTL